MTLTILGWLLDRDRVALCGALLRLRSIARDWPSAFEALVLLLTFNSLFFLFSSIGSAFPAPMVFVWTSAATLAWVAHKRALSDFVGLDPWDAIRWIPLALLRQHWTWSPSALAHPELSIPQALGFLFFALLLAVIFSLILFLFEALARAILAMMLSALSRFGSSLPHRIQARASMSSRETEQAWIELQDLHQLARARRQLSACAKPAPSGRRRRL